LSEKVIVYSDGGADPNPGIGGWAAILQYGEKEKVLTGNAAQTTNNRMELTAAIEALRALKRPCQISFHTDSQYVRRGITEWIEEWAARSWRSKTGKPVQNVDLWKALWPQVQRHEIEWHWVKGHAGDPMNERVDRLARQARLAITPPDEVDENVPRLYLRASCKGNPGPGGWGVVLVAGGETEQMSGSAVSTTNNRMEITAALEGLLMSPPGAIIQVFTTSDYLYQGITKWIYGWRQRNWQKKDGQPVANGDLWQALDQLAGQHSIQWINAKGQNNPFLEDAAKLASAAIAIA